MPWAVRRSSSCPPSKPWACYNVSSGENEGCHETEAAAQAQQRALYANTGEGKDFNPTEPRDNDGRWTDTGVGAAASQAASYTWERIQQIYGNSYDEASVPDAGLTLAVFTTGDFGLFQDAGDDRHTVMWDGFTADSARELADALDNHVTVDISDTAENDPHLHLADWEYVGDDDLIVGHDTSGDVSVLFPKVERADPANRDDWERVDLGVEDGARFVDALLEMADRRDELDQEDTSKRRRSSSLHRKHLPGLHDQSTHGRPGVKAVKKAIEAFLAGDGEGDPFDGFSRETLRKVAKDRGLEMSPGEDRDSIVAKLLAHLKDVKSGGEGRSGRTAGKDLSAWARANADRHLQPSKQWSFSDVQLAKIQAQQGFDEKPRVVSAADLDAAVGDGWIETWRGVRNVDPAWGVPAGTNPKSARDVSDELRYGPLLPGRGIYGNGTYVSVRRFTAEMFRGSYADVTGPAAFEVENLVGGADGGLTRMAIDPNARMIDYADLLTERDAWFADLKTSMSVEDRSVVSEVASDPGRFAALLGYDAIKVSGPKYNDGAEYPPGSKMVADQYVILNRTILMIQKEDPT